MDDEARRLVDDDDIGVLVNDLERDILGQEADVRGRDLVLDGDIFWT
ncbi:MAG: hypothetical protein NT147_11085 [Candidatus Aminicenantes bacterium]|nr:hypothetical protein [Candidatus Aminicenantes bacterium]